MNLLFALILSIFSGPLLGPESPQQWEFLKEHEGVKVYFRHLDCDQCGPKQEWVIFKLENTNNHDVSASWFYEQWHDGKCFGCDRDSEQFRSVTLPANSAKEGQCQSSQGPLSIWVRFHEFQTGDELEDFELADFQVEKVK